MPDFAVIAAGGFALFVAGVMLSQKVKDWLAGVPGSLRSDLAALEASIKAQVQSAQAHVVADVKAKVVPATPVLKTSAPAPAGEVLAPVTAAVTPPAA